MMYTSYERDDVMIMRESKCIRFTWYTRSLYPPWVNRFWSQCIVYFRSSASKCEFLFTHDRCGLCPHCMRILSGYKPALPQVEKTPDADHPCLRSGYNADKLRVPDKITLYVNTPLDVRRISNHITGIKMHQLYG